MYSMLFPRITSSRRLINLDGMWKILFDKDGIGEQIGYANGFESKDLIPVPSSFAEFYTEKDIREFAGDIWYETSTVIPEEWKGKNILLRFGAATHRALVYFNGILVASHEGGFTPFSCELTELVQYNKENKIVVKVNNELSNVTIPNGTTRTLKNGKKTIQGNFDFFNYSGLQRSVKLLAIPKTSIEDFEVIHFVEGTTAKVDYKVWVQNTTETCQIVLKVYDEKGKMVAASTGGEGSIIIPAVKLWKVRDAYLYQINIQILDGNNVLDEYVDNIGIRTVAVDGTNILINGEPIYIKGFGKHEDSDIGGRSYQPGNIKRDFELMKWIGANSFRTAHYPCSEEIYQMADREGFMVLDEVAAVGLIDAFSFLNAGMGSQKKGYFDGDHIPELKKNHLKALEELIKRDKNHACVIGWSLFNEPDTNSEGAQAYFKEIFEAAAKMDPQKRPRTFAMEKSSDTTNKCHQYCDFLSLNRYYGWYINGGYEIEAAIEAFQEEMDQWAALKLNKPMIFTEYGADTLSTEHKLPSVMWTQEYQVELLKECHKVFDSYEFVKGEQVWSFADFQTGEGIMRVNGNKKGIFTRQRQPKDVAYYLKERWNSLPQDFKSQVPFC